MIAEITSPLDAACEYTRRGWSVVPIPYRQKRPVIKEWGQLRLSETELPDFFNQPANLGLILGDPSGGLVDVDLDCDEARELASKYLPATEAKTGRAGAERSHWWYIAIDAKTVQHRDPVTRQMLVELRATGGQTVVGPSLHPSGESYDVLAGEPTVVAAEMLTACVAALAKRVIELRHGESTQVPKQMPVIEPIQRSTNSTDIESRALAYLDRMPPAVSGSGGHAATYAAATVLVHGFEIDPEHALSILLEHYNPRCEPAWTEKELRHKVTSAATKPHDQPRGWLLNESFERPVDVGVDLSELVKQAATTIKSQTAAIVVAADDDSEAVPESPDPGPIPDRLLSVPGFVNDVMQFTLDTAPYPNRPLAFVGALALLGTLTGRKVREPGNIRTNVQILALASSGVGKDWPRKINASILMQAGEAHKLAGKSASGEGIEDRLIRHPVILKQDDEIDNLFENMRDNKESRYRNQFGILLELYGEAGAWRAIRDRAGKESGMFYQPHLVLFGTTTPGEFYGSLSGKMLNKGLLARLITAEAGPRGRRKRALWRDPPPEIVEAARAWSEFEPPEWGNLSNESHGQAYPLVVPFTDDAERDLDRFADECDLTYRNAAKQANEPVMAIWARAVDKTTQLALIYACSVHGTAPVINRAAVNWASAFIRHTTRQTIFMLGRHFYETDFEAKCNKVVEMLTDWRKKKGDDWMRYRSISRKYRWPRREHEAIREALLDAEMIDVDSVSDSGEGRPKVVCRISVPGQKVLSETGAQPTTT